MKRNYVQKGPTLSKTLLGYLLLSYVALDRIFNFATKFPQVSATLTEELDHECIKKGVQNLTPELAQWMCRDHRQGEKIQKLYHDSLAIHERYVAIRDAAFSKCLEDFSGGCYYQEKRDKYPSLKPVFDDGTLFLVVEQGYMHWSIFSDHWSSDTLRDEGGYNYDKKLGKPEL